MVYIVAVSEFAALPKQFFQALAPQKANKTPYEFPSYLMSLQLDMFTDF